MMLLAGLAAFDSGELDAALVTGGARAIWNVARQRLLRLIDMCIAAVAALVFAEAELPPLVGVHVYAEEFLGQVALEPDPHLAAVHGWPMMVVALVCAAILSRMPRLKAGAGAAVQLGWTGRWLHVPALWRRLLPTAALLAAAAPLLLLVLGAAKATGRWPSHAGTALVTSLWVAALSSLLAAAWGWAMAAAAAHVGEPARSALTVLIWLSMLWPTALVGLAITAAGLPEWAGPAAPLVLAHTLRLLPFSAWLQLALREARPRTAAEQLIALGARGWAAWRFVCLPDALPAVAASFAVGAGLSLAELSATVLTVPAGMETTILRLYNLLHYGDQRGVMLLALLQGLTVAGLVTAVLAAWVRGTAARATRRERAGD
ncbi:MAG TPA: hypothetical protein VFP68_15920 [Burkholderiaceae bacterium]|nr:hypothetical protein [Burkholderiaceae bacterium]